MAVLAVAVVGVQDGGLIPFLFLDVVEGDELDEDTQNHLAEQRCKHLS